MLTRLRLISFVTIYCLYSATSVSANPTDSKIISGAATINQIGNKLEINQSTNKAIINWDKFNINPGEITAFNQPSAQAITLNRVVGNEASTIMGSVQANGNIVLVNRNGIMFTKGSKVDVNSIIATTADIKDADFMQNKLDFSILSPQNAIILNEGTITAKDAGMVGLVAPIMVNNGIINAKLGKVALAGGDKFTLDFYGDKLLEVAVENEDQTISAMNNGIINNSGGKIEITAAAGRNIVNSLVNVAGEINAPAIEEHNGEIFIYAEGSNAVKNNVKEAKSLKKGYSVANVPGTLNVSGYQAQQKGGKIVVLGDIVQIDSAAKIDASGDHGGGTIHIGGELKGQANTPTAQYSKVEAGASIKSNAISNGDGGTVVIWADDGTKFAGSIYAMGGKNGGDGGNVETSGYKHLDVVGHVDTAAPNGKKGSYLLDPGTITIKGNVDPSTVGNSAIWLDTSDTSVVTLFFTNLSDPSNGVIATNTITTGQDHSPYIFKGSKIRLGLNDVYTVQSVAGNTITTVEPLTANYTNAAFYNSVVSQLNDKSFGGSSTVSQIDLFNHGVFYGVNENNKYVLNTNGFNYMTGNTAPTFNNGMTTFTIAKPFSVSSASFGQTIWAVGDDNVQNLSLEVNRGANAGKQSTLWGGALIDVGTQSLSAGQTYLFGADRSGTAGNWQSNLYLNGKLDHTSNVATNPDATNKIIVGALSPSGGYSFPGQIGEILAYDSALSVENRQLVDQYLSAKWSIGLTPPGTGLSEADKATAADGYSTFSMDYLKRLSATTNINLLATNDINLDLNNGIFALPDDRSITFTTTNGNINSLSPGTITTRKMLYSGGDITMNAGGSMDISNLNLDAQNGGVVSLTSNGNMKIGNVSANTITAHAQGATSDLTIDTGKTLTTTDSNAAITLTADKALDISSATLDAQNGGTVSLNSSDNMKLGDISAGSILAQAQGAASDLTVATGKTLTTTFSNAAMILTADKALDVGDATLNAQNGGSVALISNDVMKLGNITAGNLVAHAQGNASDLVINAGKTISGTNANTAITLVADRNFIYNAGISALSAPNGRWLVYSTDPAANTLNGLTSTFKLYDCTYLGSCTIPTTGTGLIYKVAEPVVPPTPPTPTPSNEIARDIIAEIINIIVNVDIKISAQNNVVISQGQITLPKLNSINISLLNGLLEIDPNILQIFSDKS